MLVAPTGVQHTPVRPQGVYQHGVRVERRHGHVPVEETRADRAADPVVAVADTPRLRLHARRGRGAPGRQMSEHTSDREPERARRRLRVLAVREHGPEPARGDRVRNGGILGARTAHGQRNALQPREGGRVGHRRGAVCDGQQRAAVSCSHGAAQVGRAQKTGRRKLGARKEVSRDVYV